MPAESMPRITLTVTLKCFSESSS